MSFWRTDDPVLAPPDERGVRKVIQGGMWPSGRAWWKLHNEIKLLVGGYGSGKTRQLCKWGIATALHNAPAWTALVSPNFPLARRTLLPTLVELLDGKCTVRHDMSYEWNKSDHQFIISIEGRPPATILYLSGENPQNLKGPNLGCAGIDEPFIQNREVFVQMHARLRDPRARAHQMGLTGTPEQLNWGYEIAEGDEKGRYDLGIIYADTRENLALPPNYVEKLLKSYDERTAEAYIRGRFVSLTTGRVFHAFDRARNVKEIEVALNSAEVTWFAGMDFNVNPMAFCVGWKRGEQVHFVEEFELPNSDTQYACSIIQEKYPQVRLVYPDPSGRQRHTNAPAGITDFHWIQRAKMIVMAPQEPWPRRDSFNAVNNKLGRGEMTVSPRCKRLIRYMQELSHETLTQQKAMTHLTDAMRYPVTFMFPCWRPTSTVTAISA